MTPSQFADCFSYSVFTVFCAVIGALPTAFVILGWCPLCDRLAAVGLISFFILCVRMLWVLEMNAAKRRAEEALEDEDEDDETAEDTNRTESDS